MDNFITNKKNPEGIKVWFYGEMLRRPCTDTVTKEEVLKRIGIYKETTTNNKIKR